MFVADKTSFVVHIRYMSEENELITNHNEVSPDTIETALDTHVEDLLPTVEHAELAVTEVEEEGK